MCVCVCVCEYIVCVSLCVCQRDKGERFGVLVINIINHRLCKSYYAKISFKKTLKVLYLSSSQKKKHCWQVIHRILNTKGRWQNIFYNLFYENDNYFSHNNINKCVRRLDHKNRVLLTEDLKALYRWRAFFCYILHE